MRILVTGSKGLLGRTLCPLLQSRGYTVISFDLKGTAQEWPHDVTNGSDVMRQVMENQVDGIIHLAAVSRVIWGEQNPAKCVNVNLNGTLNVLDAARQRRAWVLFASSREVYGAVAETPVKETAARRPVSTYALTKALGEDLVRAAGDLVTGVVRLSNVYGDIHDHPDRVTPAFARAAAECLPITLRGPEKVFDFVHVSDAARGLMFAAEHLDRAGRLPLLHLVTGVGTSLDDLAARAGAAAQVIHGHRPTIEAAESLGYEVSGFVGDPARAQEILGWRAGVSLENGFQLLVDDFRKGRSE